MPDQSSIPDPFLAARDTRDAALRTMEQLCNAAIAEIIHVPIQAAAFASQSGLRIEIRFRAGTPLASVIDLAELVQSPEPYPEPINKLFGLEADSPVVAERAASLLLNLRRLAEDLQVLGQRLVRYTPKGFLDG